MNKTIVKQRMAIIKRMEKISIKNDCLSLGYFPYGNYNVYACPHYLMVDYNSDDYGREENKNLKLDLDQIFKREDNLFNSMILDKAEKEKLLIDAKKWLKTDKDKPYRLDVGEEYFFINTKYLIDALEWCYGDTIEIKTSQTKWAMPIVFKNENGYTYVMPINKR